MTRVIRNPAVVCTDLDDGAVLLDLDTTAYYSLNRTAVGIWKLIGDQPMVEVRESAFHRVRHQHPVAL